MRCADGQRVQKTERNTHEEHSVDVVNISVLPSAVMDDVPWHADFRTVEDGRLVHVVPDKQILRRVLTVSLRVLSY